MASPIELDGDLRLDEGTKQKQWMFEEARDWARMYVRSDQKTFEKGRLMPQQLQTYDALEFSVPSS